AAASASRSPSTIVPATSSPGRSEAPAGTGYRPFLCSTSGRLTPEAVTRISASPAPNVGVGRSVSRSTSGLPGAVISIALTSASLASLVRDGRRELARRRVAVEQRLHRQLDAALLVRLEDLDADDLAFLQVVGDLLDALV